MKDWEAQIEEYVTKGEYGLALLCLSHHKSEPNYATLCQAVVEAIAYHVVASKKL